MYKSLNEFEIRPDATTGFHGNHRVIMAVIFLPMKPTPFTVIVPKAKKYLFFPIRARKIPKMSGNFPIKL